MNALPLLLLAAAFAPAPTRPVGAERHPGAMQVFHCDFGDAWDANHDEFPDGWTRKQGIGFPHYLKIGLDDRAAAVGKRSLRIDLDGGAATVYSPPIEVGPEFSYVLESQVRTEGLHHNRAFVTVTFYDDSREPIKTFRSARLGEVKDWTMLRIPPMIPPSKDVAFVVIGLHLHPGSKKGDIRGAAMFDDVWLAHLPRMTVQINSEHNIFTENDKVVVTCRVSGILERDPEITFELVDISSHGVDRTSRRLQGRVVQRKSSKASSLPGLHRNATAGFAGDTQWSPTIGTPGFYRVQVTMAGRKKLDGQRETLMQRREVSFAIVRPERPHAGGEFGWTIPSGDAKLSLTALDELLGHSAVSWVKFPVWYSHKDTDRAARLGRFADRLSARGIRLIGLLSEPPEDIRPQFGESKKLYAADIFSTDTSLWYGSLEPVMTRLSSKVSYWQLGLDQDSSFVGYPDLARRIRDVKHQLEKFGQDAKLGLGWRWNNELNPPKDNSWAFVSLFAEPPLTGFELASYMDATKDVGTKRWVVVEPLDRDEYDIEDRAADLVRRMMVAKIKGADGIFIPEPFSNRRGVMNDDGTPGELFLTWRTTALALSGSKYLGSIRLPGGSHNRIFSRGDDAVMVVWNDKPTREVIWLGSDIRQIDLWGRFTTPATQEHRQVIQVGPLPTFITGVHEPITRMRMSFAFTETKLPSVFGKEHQNSFTMQNFFPQGAGGHITFVSSRDWRFDPQNLSFKMATNEKMTQRFMIELRDNANSGRQSVRVDFDMNVDERYQFSVYRHIDVGLGDVEIRLSTSLSKTKGHLIVRQEMINYSNRIVDFKCTLQAPGRRRMRTQVIRLAKGKDVKTYRIGNGRELIGQMLRLRAEEMEGQRVLKYTVIAKE